MRTRSSIVQLINFRREHGLKVKDQSAISYRIISVTPDRLMRLTAGFTFANRGVVFDGQKLDHLSAQAALGTRDNKRFRTFAINFHQPNRRDVPLRKKSIQRRRLNFFCAITESPVPGKITRASIGGWSQVKQRLPLLIC